MSLICLKGISQYVLGKILLPVVPHSNCHVMDPFEKLFKLTQHPSKSLNLILLFALKTSLTQCCTSRKGPRTHSKNNWCKIWLVYTYVSLIVRSQQHEIELVTRPGTQQILGTLLQFASCTRPERCRSAHRAGFGWHPDQQAKERILEWGLQQVWPLAQMHSLWLFTIYSIPDGVFDCRSGIKDEAMKGTLSLPKGPLHSPKWFAGRTRCIVKIFSSSKSKKCE